MTVKRLRELIEKAYNRYGIDSNEYKELLDFAKGLEVDLGKALSEGEEFKYWFDKDIMWVKVGYGEFPLDPNEAYALLIFLLTERVHIEILRTKNDKSKWEHTTWYRLEEKE